MRYAFIMLAFGLLIFQTAHADDDREPLRSVSVSAEAEVKVTPDKAEIYVNLQEQARKAEDAKKEVDAQLKALREIAEDMGIPEKDLRTTYTSVQPVYRYERDGNKRVFDGYNVVYSVQVTLRKLDQVGVFIEQALAVKIDEIGNVQYGVENEDAAKEEALEKAAMKARRKAEALAHAAGEEIGHVLTLAEGGVSFQPMPIPMYKTMAMEASAGATPAPSPPPGEIAVTAQVSAVFALR